MLKGDLVTTPLPQVLRQLADSASTGCLHVLDARDEEGRVYLRGGRVYAVQVGGQRPLLGQNLVSSGALGPEMLAEAIEAQRTELQGWKLGELLVHLGYVDAPVVEEFLAEQVRDQAGDLLRWPTGTWKFRVNERTREDVAKPVTVEDLLGDCERRATEWSVLTELIHGPEAIPVLSAEANTDGEMAIDPEAWSLLCKVDGTRSLAELALESGFTLYEAGRVVHGLVRAGLLEVEDPVLDLPVYEEPETASVAARLTAAFAPAAIPHQVEEHTAAEMADLLATALREDRAVTDLAPPSDAEVDGSIDRISAALSAMLGPTTDDALFAPKPRRETKPASPEPTAKEKEKAERDKRRRDRDAAELAAAQAELEAARRAAEGSGPDAEIVDLQEVRREAARRDEAEARQAQEAQLAEEARQLETEKAALAAERKRLKEEAAAAEEERLRAAEEARLAEVARKAEAERLAEEARQEELRREEQARQAEEERLRAAEEARLAEARARLEEEKAALAAERAALEDEAREAEAERVRLLEAARIAQEEAEATRAAAEAEAARLAEEVRQAQEAAEAARLAEEARLAQEAADAEAARLLQEAADAEAARLLQEAADAQAARLLQEAADAEAAYAAQAEAERLAAEAAHRALVEDELRREAEAQAAYAAAEAERLASEENARAAAEAQSLADVELEEQARQHAQRTAASAAFTELSMTAASAPIPTVEPDPEPVYQAPPEPPGHGPMFSSPEPVRAPAADTDMASLFRELSSLGVEDAPPSAPVAPRAPRPVPPSAQPKKKKGLFGR